MTTTVCDICGKEIPLEVYSRPIKDYKFCLSSYGKVWDICQDCRDEFNAWMKERKVEKVSE